MMWWIATVSDGTVLRRLVEQAVVPHRQGYACMVMMMIVKMFQVAESIVCCQMGGRSGMGS